MIGSLLAQLCEGKVKLWEEIDEKYREAKEQSQREPRKLDIEELEDLLVHCCENLSGAFVVIDAINESRQSSKILQILLRLTQRSSLVRILISSTEELGMDQGHLPVTVVAMKPDQTAIDINHYIDNRIEFDDRFHAFPLDLKDDIKAVLRDRSDGMYDILHYNAMMHD